MLVIRCAWLCAVVGCSQHYPVPRIHVEQITDAIALHCNHLSRRIVDESPLRNLVAGFHCCWVVVIVATIVFAPRTHPVRLRWNCQRPSSLWHQCSSCTVPRPGVSHLHNLCHTACVSSTPRHWIIPSGFPGLYVVPIRQSTCFVHMALPRDGKLHLCCVRSRRFLLRCLTSSNFGLLLAKVLSNLVKVGHKYQDTRGDTTYHSTPQPVVLGPRVAACETWSTREDLHPATGRGGLLRAY